jgi:hypothetical protein
MSFLFPANPADGDIIVQPQPDGSFIKGTYDAANNLWAVGELPEEPGVPGPEGPKGDQGDKGDPGKGLAISGVVGTESELPLASDHIFQFYIVDDVNKVFYSDGFQWFDLGGPIVGPQGPAGTDGTNGTDGIDGAPGKGWTSTTIIDERPTNYQVSFNSDDGLGFVTDNILGPQGETGSLAVATADTIGGIKIGRGLNILPDGTAQAGETSVDLETVPLSPEGTVYSYYIGLKPVVVNWGASYDRSQNIYPGIGDLGGNPQVFAQTDVRSVGPDELGDANAAIVLYQARSQIKPSPNLPGGAVTSTALRTYLTQVLKMTNAVIPDKDDQDGLNQIGFPITHNLTIKVNSESIIDRRSSQPAFTKNQIITFTPGVTLSFQHQTLLSASSPCILEAGSARVVLIPFKVDDTSTLYEYPEADTLRAGSDEDMDNLINDYFPPQTVAETAAEQAQYLKQNMYDILNTIQIELLNIEPGATRDALLELQTTVYALRDLPGTFADLNSLMNQYLAEAIALLGFDFRFQ